MIYIFLGPSLEREEAKQILDAVYLPPLRPGMITKLLPSKPSIIAIFDGTPSLNCVAKVESEVREAADQGCRVIGAVGFGAALAMNNALGLTGLGRVFSCLSSLPNSHFLDEVRAAHGSHAVSYRRITISLVDMRLITTDLLDSNDVSAQIGKAMVRSVELSHFLDRSPSRIIKSVAKYAPKCAAKAEQRLACGSLPSEQDARSVLRDIAISAGIGKVDFVTLGTTHLKAKTTTSIEENEKVVRKKVLLRILARSEFDRLGLPIPQRDELCVMSERFRGDFGLREGKTLAEWLTDKKLDIESYVDTLHDFLLIQKLEKLYADKIDQLIHDQVAFNSARDWSAIQSTSM